MFVVSPIQGSYQPKKRVQDDSSKEKSFSDELNDKQENVKQLLKSYDEMDDILNRRLTALRMKLDGLNSALDVPNRRNIFFPDIEVLNKELQSSQKTKLCPECQDTYKQNSRIAREVVVYRGKGQRVEIIS